MCYQIRLGKKPTKNNISDEKLIRRLDEKSKWLKELLDEIKLTDKALYPDCEQK